MELIYLVMGLLIGASAAFFFAKNKFSAQPAISREEADALNQRVTDLLMDKTRLETSNKLQEANLKTLTEQLKDLGNKHFDLNASYSSLKSDYQNLQQKLSDQKNEIEDLQKRFTTEFKNIANEILEDKSKRFTEQNKTNIDAILRPLNDKIKDFEKKVDDVYVNDSKERAGLLQQIKSLHELNIQMSKDANNLTKALKGEAKTQGNWGEFILEGILEKSGLVKDREYKVQESITNEDGKRLQPDVIIYLPDNKCLIVDSKVSLTAYEKYNSTEDETERIFHGREHVTSIRRHIQGLSAKNYQNLYNIKSLDFVLLFMPIEPAFSAAVQKEPGIFNEAFEKNIVIVSPSTLLATLRTIASIWRQENQNKNALEIARQSGALYDKFTGMLTDLIDIGKKLNSTRDAYDDVMKKISTGKGNLITSVEKIKKLGAKTTKSIPQNIVNNTEDEEAPELLEEETL